LNGGKFGLNVSGLELGAFQLALSKAGDEAAGRRGGRFRAAQLNSQLGLGRGNRCGEQ
jgi:hypothetical protein